MSVPGARVVIAGAGWRVRRFVLPALREAGVRPGEITCIRRTASGAIPDLPGVRVVDSMEALPAAEASLTVNCVAAESLVAVQAALLRRYPRALHFCDTPIFHPNDSVRMALRLRTRRLFALEDWPLLPNLAHIACMARAARGPATVRIEHFGISLHFFAWLRGLMAPLLPFRRMVSRDGADLVAVPRRGARVIFRGPKQFPLAKVSFETEGLVLEDFHEVEPAPHANDEILYRVVDDAAVRYFRGQTCFADVPVSRALIDAFQPFADRRNVHELDKCLALTRLFRSAMGPGDVTPYAFIHSVRDTLTTRCLETRLSCALR